MPGSLTTTNDASGKTYYVVTGGGSDIWNTSDNFYYAYMRATNDFDYVVRVASHIGNTGDGGWSKAELMARLDDGGGVPQGGDPFIANMANRPASDTANGLTAGVNHRGPQWRAIRDNQCSWTTPNPEYPPNADHNWLRLERVGNCLYMYTGDDGKTWNMYTPYSPQGWDTSGSWPAGADNSGVSQFTNAWPNVINLGLAVCAHNDADVSTVVWTDFAPYTPIPIAITTQPAATVALAQNTPLTLSVAATGDPVHYQWLKNGVAIPQAVSPTYSIAWTQPSDAGSYTVRVFGGGKQIVSSPSVVTVTVDTTPPTLVSATSSATFDTVMVTFSEPLDGASSTNPANYKIDNGVTVAAATAGATVGTVFLTTSKQPAGTALTLTVNNVKDVPGNVIAANSKITFKTFVFATGYASYNRWENDQNNVATFADGIASGTYGPPTFSSAVTPFDGPWGTGINNYNSQTFGWFTAPFSGDYVFFVAADDACNLYLSTDDTPANKKLIAQESGWSNEYQWQTVGGGSSASDKRSDTFSSPEWPTANTITLVAGNKYYIEMLHHQGTGGDGAGATFVKAGDPDPAQNAAGMFIKGSAIATYLDSSGSAINITQQPADTTGVDGKTVMFKAAATGTSLYGSTVSYQWQKAPSGSTTFTNIPGATASSYLTPLLTLADSGSKFQVICSVPALSQTSSAATLTVIPDTFPPVPSVGTIKRNDGVIEVGVGFDEAVQPAGLVAANFSLVGGGTITSFKLTTNGYGDYTGVLLDTTGLVPGTSYQVNVKNVSDLKGNAVAAAGVNVPFKLGNMSWADTGTPIAPGQVIPVAPDGVDILNGGRGEWGTYDEATIAYVQKTNDFDVKVEVIYAEPSSQWARVGLIARNSLNVGEDPNDRNLSDGTSSASAYAQTHVNPPQTLASSGRWPTSEAIQPANPTPNNSHEQNCRLGTGAPTQGWGSPGTAPTYPNAWLRLQRTGTNIFGYRSEDGVNWISQGSVTLTNQQPNMYVGPFMSVELGNVWGGNFDVWGSPFDPKYDRLFVAQFRNFGDVAAPVPSLSPLTIQLSGNNITISWTGAGTLQQSAAIGAAASWSDVTGVTGTSYTTKASGNAAYFRLKQ